MQGADYSKYGCERASLTSASLKCVGGRIGVSASCEALILTLSMCWFRYSIIYIVTHLPVADSGKTFRIYFKFILSKSRILKATKEE